MLKAWHRKLFFPLLAASALPWAAFLLLWAAFNPLPLSLSFAMPTAAALATGLALTFRLTRTLAPTTNLGRAQVRPTSSSPSETEFSSATAEPESKLIAPLATISAEVQDFVKRQTEALARQRLDLLRRAA